MDPRERCGDCGQALPARARFCPACGTAIALGATLEGSRPVRSVERAVTVPSHAEVPRVRLDLGTRLADAYVLESVLGEGGMGIVYRAHDQVRDRSVALKVLHSNLAGDPDIRRRFAREARVLRTFTHPGVVAVHDFVEHDHMLALVMELVEGPTLVGHLERWRGRMPLDEIAELFGDVLDTMAEAHAQGIVHRDLKPDNILLKPGRGRMHPKIVDFGIAKILEGTTYTVTGALLGTCRYMSPEQIQSVTDADHRSDIYSLGVTLYQLLTGRAPFDAEGQFAQMMAHVNDRPAPPSRFRAELPPALDALLGDALAKRPDARPPTCAVFKERLLEALPRRAPVRSSEPAVSLPPLLREADGAELVLIPSGPFKMGPTRREVDLDAFYLDRTPVTNAQFRRFLEVTGYRPDDGGKARFLAHWQRGKVPPGLDDHPVVYVSWTDARAYASWAGKRLPTEAEWEKAARGTDGRKYPWGSGEPGPDRAHFGGRRKSTAPVGSCPAGASPFGILDLAGNVWEWCEDTDDPTFYVEGPSHNPRNTRRTDRPVHVMRGGSWMYGPRALRTTARTSFEPHYRFAGGGFRCARDP